MAFEAAVGVGEVGVVVGAVVTPAVDQVVDKEVDVAVDVAGEAVPVEKGERRVIALNRLFLSARNVRKRRDPATIPALAAMIEAQGLLYPLCVVREKRKGVKGESFGVVAGGRRLAAMMWLVEQGRLAKDAPVECLFFGMERATAVSLVENVSQEPMHPADQLEAFKKHVDEGMTVGQIAVAFGVSVLTVKRRLKLANLAPMFIALFREDRIEQGQLQALALSDDQSQQVAVWESLSPYQRSPHYIKQALTAEEIRSDLPLVRFVGIDAYREAGGTVRADFFAEGSESFLQDGVLLNRLAQEKLESHAAAKREAGWKWTEWRLSFPYAEKSRFAHLHCEAAEPSKAEAAAIAAVEAELASLRSRMDDLDALNEYDEDTGEDREWTDAQRAESESLEHRWDELDGQRDALLAALRVWTPEQKAMAGVVVYIGDGGALVAAEGLVRAEDRKEMAAGSKEASGAGPGAPSFESMPKERAEFSSTLCQNLTAHRTAAVAAALTQSPKVALAALLHTVIAQEREPWQRSPIGVRFNSNASDIARCAAEFDQAPAAHTLEQAETWADHLPGDAARLFDRLKSMDVPQLLDLLARCVARSYSVQGPAPERSNGRGFDAALGIEQALGLDMGDWWSPTSGRYLEHVSKAKMIEAVTQACGAEAARPLEKMKKAEAVKSAEALLEGKRWLPSTLRPYADHAEAEAADNGAQD
ncbi:ParB/RepB/Spo0J family partition protein [Variovorax sp. KK3]|uniref:ParB/RepB/Spo0J family partition protein n=1 Tax=Variovorax sp. KK3 TaxID=1855728 RepID=UPI00097C2CBE|nr:ParB/RepB/Spo0J family partition protein [Variovorax sp. KK3]